jgi:hypothetical protein
MLCRKPLIIKKMLSHILVLFLGDCSINSNFFFVKVKQRISWQNKKNFHFEYLRIEIFNYVSCVLGCIALCILGCIFRVQSTDESIICSMWKGVNMYWKPSIMIELDFKIVHYCIFTNERLLKMKLIDNDS